MKTDSTKFRLPMPWDYVRLSNHDYLSAALKSSNLALSHKINKPAAIELNNPEILEKMVSEVPLFDLKTIAHAQNIYNYIDWALVDAAVYRYSVKVMATQNRKYSKFKFKLN